jgi:antitoxin VapB
MNYAKVFISGNSQAVRLPKEFRLNSEQVEIFRRGNELILRERPTNAAAAFDALSALADAIPDDFLATQRNDSAPQNREAL